MGEKTTPSLLDLMGCAEDDASVKRALQELHTDQQVPLPEPQRQSFGALRARPPCVYHNYQALGLSLCFEGSLLQAIHLYNGTHGYVAYQGALPHGVRMQMRGEEIVKLLGEPDGKMGGGRGGPISLAYKGKGLQFNFVGNDWEDNRNVLDSVTVHEPI